MELAVQLVPEVIKPYFLFHEKKCLISFVTFGDTISNDSGHTVHFTTVKHIFCGNVILTILEVKGESAKT